MNKKYISDLTIKEYKLYNTLAKLRSQGKITQEQFDYKLKQILTKGEWMDNFGTILRLYLMAIFHIIFSTIILTAIFWAIFILRLTINFITN